MTDTPVTFLDPYIPTIMSDTGYENPKTDLETIYLENINIDEFIRQKPRKKYLYESNMHNICNPIVGHNNEQLQEKVA